MNVGMQHIAIKAPFEMQHVVPVCSFFTLKNFLKSCLFLTLYSRSNPSSESLYFTKHLLVVKQSHSVLFMIYIVSHICWNQGYVQFQVDISISESSNI